MLHLIWILEEHLYLPIDLIRWEIFNYLDKEKIEMFKTCPHNYDDNSIETYLWCIDNNMNIAAAWLMNEYNLEDYQVKIEQFRMNLDRKRDSCIIS